MLGVNILKKVFKIIGTSPTDKVKFISNASSLTVTLSPIPTILIFLLGYKMFKNNKKKGR